MTEITNVREIKWTVTEGDLVKIHGPGITFDFRVPLADLKRLAATLEPYRPS